jgi:hypothetical protein
MGSRRRFHICDDILGIDRSRKLKFLKQEQKVTIYSTIRMSKYDDKLPSFMYFVASVSYQMFTTQNGGEKR